MEIAMDNEIDTMAGVVEHDSPAGTIRVEREDGSTCVTLTVEDGTGAEVQVFLSYYQVARLMMTLGAAGWQI